MHHLSDQDIILLVLQGNTRAYAVLVDRYKSYVFTLSLRFFPDANDAEEAAQDVFIKAYKALNSYNATAKFSTWLYSITTNTCISRVRQNRNTIIHQSEEQMIFHAGHENNTEQKQDQKYKKEIINKAITMLPEDESLIVYLFYTHEQSIDEICHIMNINRSNAKVKLHRARKKLREIMDTHFKNELDEYNRK